MNFPYFCFIVVNTICHFLVMTPDRQSYLFDQSCVQFYVLLSRASILCHGFGLFSLSSFFKFFFGVWPLVKFKKTEHRRFNSQCIGRTFMMESCAYLTGEMCEKNCAHKVWWQRRVCDAIHWCASCYCEYVAAFVITIRESYPSAINALTPTH